MSGFPDIPGIPVLRIPVRAAVMLLAVPVPDITAVADPGEVPPPRPTIRNAPYNQEHHPYSHKNMNKCFTTQEQHSKRTYIESAFRPSNRH
jgi:hypothetical protein